ncbi:hypothetical protein M918_01615 [Clostridium sp. BL8]|nr:hypothetical protein M918_01615 [Clostridium sp. BL8]
MKIDEDIDLFIFEDIGFLSESLIYSSSKSLMGTKVGLMYKLSFNSGSL